MEGDRIVEAPLQTLNKPPKPRHPSGDSKGSLTDRVALIAAISTHCGGNLDLAYEIAASKPAREVISILEDLCWLRKTPEERRKAEFKDWGKGERQKLRAMRGKQQ